jgi:hypothetical protein
MKKIIYFIATILMLGSMPACVDLDTTPYSEITGGNMWTTEDLVEKGVIGVYSSLKKPIIQSQITGGGSRLGYYGLDVLGMSGSSRLAVSGLFTSSVNPGNTYFSDMWKWGYDGVHRANAAIANIPNANMDNEKKAKRLAEVKVLRAFFYGRLNEIFGNGGLGVPLYLEPVAADECIATQTPEADIWAQIIKDLTEAIEEPNLPNNDINGEGRVSKGCAYALRGHAYLLTKKYAEAAADYAKVETCGYKLFTGAGANSYKMLFKEANERCEEMILSIQYIANSTGGDGGYGSDLQKYLALWQQGAKDAQTSWGDVRISPAVVDLYEVVNPDGSVKDFNWTDYIPEWNATSRADRKVFFLRDSLYNGAPIHSTITAVINGSGGLGSISAAAKSLYNPATNEARIKAVYANRDPRLAFNVVVPYAEFKGLDATVSEVTYVYRFPISAKVQADKANSESKYVAGYLPSGCLDASAQFVYAHRKFVGEGAEFAYRTNNPIDEPILRYADVLLQWAEALVESNDLNGAKAKVKLVRDRAGIATPDVPFANQTAARNYVRDERRREFVGEGINFFDEMRWRTLKDTKFARGGAEEVYGGLVGTAGTYNWIGDQWYTWPVPRTEIERNPNLKPTPGWVYE